jgi:hypothetical protein
MNTRIKVEPHAAENDLFELNGIRWTVLRNQLLKESFHGIALN